MGTRALGWRVGTDIFCRTGLNGIRIPYLSLWISKDTEPKILVKIQVSLSIGSNFSRECSQISMHGTVTYSAGSLRWRSFVMLFVLIRNIEGLFARARVFVATERETPLYVKVTRAHEGHSYAPFHNQIMSYNTTFIHFRAHQNSLCLW